jgi:hypothetical protein
MGDDPMHSGHHPPVRQRRPGEPLWTIRVNHITYSAELKFHGESCGWECQISEYGPHDGRRFIRRDAATRWAESEWKEIEATRRIEPRRPRTVARAACSALGNL